MPRSAPTRSPSAAMPLSFSASNASKSTWEWSCCGATQLCVSEEWRGQAATARGYAGWMHSAAATGANFIPAFAPERCCWRPQQTAVAYLCRGSSIERLCLGAGLRRRQSTCPLLLLHCCAGNARMFQARKAAGRQQARAVGEGQGHRDRGTRLLLYSPGCHVRCRPYCRTAWGHR